MEPGKQFVITDGTTEKLLLSVDSWGFQLQVICTIVINPLRMRSRVTVVCQSVCMSVYAQIDRVLISAIQMWYYQNRHDT